jgi:hypothetical protein
MKEKFQKYYLSYVYVVLSTCGFAHSPKLSDIGEITEASWELLWEWHRPTERRLWHMCGGWQKQNQFQVPKESSQQLVVIACHSQRISQPAFAIS